MLLLILIRVRSCGVSRAGVISPPYGWTPFAVRGVAWIPGKDNISEDVSKYSPSLEVYAASLAGTYGQEEVPFLYAQPAASLVEGIAAPQVRDAVSIGFDEWPKTLEAIATQLGTLAAERFK